jgi:hypothetical protein
VTVNAANVTIKNCLIRGSAGDGSSNTALVMATSTACVNLLVEDCTLVPDTPSLWWNGINGHDFTARRCEIYHTVDGMGVYPNTGTPGIAVNVLIESNYIHSLSYFTPDPNHSTTDNQTHNDGLQLQGGSGIVVRYNSINGVYATDVGSTPRPDNGGSVGSPGYTQGGSLQFIQCNNNVGNLQNIEVYDNWLRGGKIGFNVGSVVRASGQVLGYAYRNRFDRQQGLQGSGGDTTYTINLDASWADASGIAASDMGEGTANRNVYDDNGHEVLVRRTG